MAGRQSLLSVAFLFILVLAITDVSRRSRGGPVEELSIVVPFPEAARQQQLLSTASKEYMDMYADGFIDPAAAKHLPKYEWDTFDPTTYFEEHGEPMSHLPRVMDPDLRVMESYLKTGLNDDKKNFIDFTKVSSNAWYSIPLSVRASVMAGKKDAAPIDDDDDAAEEEDISTLPKDELGRKVDALIPNLSKYDVATDPALEYYMAEQYLRGNTPEVFLGPRTETDLIPPELIASLTPEEPKNETMVTVTAPKSKSHKAKSSANDDDAMRFSSSMGKKKGGKKFKATPTGGSTGPGYWNNAFGGVQKWGPDGEPITEETHPPKVLFAARAPRFQQPRA